MSSKTHYVCKSLIIKKKSATFQSIKKKAVGSSFPSYYSQVWMQNHIGYNLHNIKQKTRQIKHITKSIHPIPIRPLFLLTILVKLRLCIYIWNHTKWLMNHLISDFLIISTFSNVGNIHNAFVTLQQLETARSLIFDSQS